MLLKCAILLTMLIKIKVYPGAKEGRVVEKMPDAFDVYVREKLEDGLATKAVILALALHFGISRSKVRLIKGLKMRNKIFNIIF